MSAFVVSSKHVAALANYAVAKKVWLGERSAQAGDFGRIYKTLAVENVRSVCHRYADEQPEAYVDFVRPQGEGKAVINDPVQIIKLAQCLDYQSCETDDWKDTRACKLLRSITTAAIDALPGYNDAKWAI